MSAYVIADVDVTDPDVYEQYRKGMPATLAPFGARFVVRGGAFDVLEGDWNPKRIIVIEFPDMAALKAWYTSAEYQSLMMIRQPAARARLLAVEGV